MKQFVDVITTTIVFTGLFGCGAGFFYCGKAALEKTYIDYPFTTLVVIAGYLACFISGYIFRIKQEKEKPQ